MTAHHLTARQMILAWAGLLVLTTATLLVSFVAKGGWEIFSALAFALVKSTVVGLVFMHLWEQKGTNRFVLVTALAFVAILVTLVVTDVSFRLPLAVQPPELP